MMKKIIYIFVLSLSLFLFSSVSLAVEVAPRISDKEIVERLSRLEEGQNSLNKRIDDLRSKMNIRFEGMDKGFEAIDKRFDDLRSEMNSRFDMLTWILGLYITISMVILGFVIKMQWQMQKRQTQMEASLITQKDEIIFLKGLIEKLFPPKGVL